MKQHPASNGVPAKSSRFTIDDAFEEETDEAIKVYGSTDQGGQENAAGGGGDGKLEPQR